MSIKEQIIAGLKTIEELLDEKGEVNFVKLYQGVESYEPSLMGKLFNIPIIREKFFQKIQLGSDKTEVLGGGYLFKIDSLKLFLEENQINNSFTAFTNQIGLSKGKEFLKYNTDIVLDFPFKDCILEGGASNDEGKDNYYEYDDKKGFVLKQDRRQEIFYNNVIAQDEITRLTEKKAFTNFKKFTKDGEVSFSGFTKDENGNIKDNLIIKGNNLLALYSLKEKFAGKVKMIYIDPPYNTGNDSFGYNDKFNHSTWLTFMKNRLEVAKELLRDDGVIFVQCDDNEQAYLKVLMDEVFGKENFVSNIITRATPNGRDYGLIAKMHEHILFYAKKIAISSTNLIEVTNKSFSFSDAIGDFNIHPLYNSNVRFNINTSKNLYYPFYVNPNKVDNNGFYEISLEQKEGWVEVFPPKSVKEGIQFIWRWGREKSFENLNKEIVGHKLKNGEFRVVQKMRGNEQLARTIWDETEISNRRGTEDLQKLFNKKVFSYPKSEHLLKKIIHIATNPGDIVLDYHLGSGTTCAVAHKMGRQYIGIEQMDYIETIPVERLKKVIEGEQGGISKDVEWKGGGEFVYLELAKLNKDAIETIQSLKDYESLKTFFLEMKDKYFLKYNLKIQKFIDEILNSDKFKRLPLDEQKVMLITMLDNNQLYINADDIEDTSLSIFYKKENMKLTKEFYN